MKILLADDDNNIHLIVRMWLSRNGHEVVSAYNGKEALAKIQEEDFQGLITDVNMPLMKGIDLVKKVLQQKRRPELIVVLTSRCDTGHLSEELDSGSVHLFNKPFSPSKLAELIEKLDKETTIHHEHAHARSEAKTSGVDRV